jgi:RHS repeat-associated protein
VKDKYKRYYAFGAPDAQTVSTDQAYRYTGKPFDEDGAIDLYYYGARYYDPYLGAFPAIDPRRGDYPSLSPYVYAADNPLKYKDPNGQWINFAIGAAIGAVTEIGGQIAVGMVEGKSFGDAVGGIDWSDVGVSTALGAATSGLSAIKAIGTAGKIGIAVASNVAEGAIQANTGTTTSEYGAGEAAVDAITGLGGGVAGEVVSDAAKTSKKAGQLTKAAKKAQNIADAGRPRAAQTKRAAVAAKKASQYGTTAATATGATTTETTEDILRPQN